MFFRLIDHIELTSHREYRHSIVKQRRKFRDYCIRMIESSPKAMKKAENTRDAQEPTSAGGVTHPSWHYEVETPRWRIKGGNRVLWIAGGMFVGGLASGLIIANGVGQRPAPVSEQSSPTRGTPPLQSSSSAVVTTPIPTHYAPLAPSPATISASDPKLATLRAAIMSDDGSGGPAVIAALEALAEKPAEALVVGKTLMQSHPDRAPVYGANLVAALVRNSAYSEALELSAAGPMPDQVEWMATVFTGWGAARPAEAKRLADMFKAKGVAGPVYSALIRGWSLSAPAEAATYASELPPGELRSTALRLSIEQWIQQDPVALNKWLPHLTDSKEFDFALSQLATKTDRYFRTSRVAIEWAESISNAELRRETLAMVMRQWFAEDPIAAKDYAAHGPGLTSSQRQQLLAILGPAVVESE